MITIEQEKLEWLVGDDTGISSKAIWCAMVGLTPRDRCTPCDPSDFGRCYRLLEKFPDWKARVKELGQLIGYAPKVNGEQRPNLWQIFADNYEEMAALYREERPSGSAPNLYTRMDALGF